MSETRTAQRSYRHDTIAAAATPPGSGGIAVVRVSGPATPAIATTMLGHLPPPRRATLCDFRDSSGSCLDTGIALYFPAPNSFTGEDVLELHGHGGPVPVASLVDAAIALGARRAEPGEFTKRAFLNDKLDLVQAEAIADLIGSGSQQAARAALRSLSGAFSTAVDALQERLVRLRLHVEAAIDFPEEEIDFLSDGALREAIDECATAFTKLGNEARVGRVLRDGYQIAIVGRPNAGKSSLLNLLSGQDAAIVTEVAGTTRDILRERIDIDGLSVELIDTAGLREDPDRIEAEGIRRARQAMQTADAILWIQDATEGEGVQRDFRDEALPEGVPIIVVRNKTDLSGEREGASGNEPRHVRLSAKTGAGVDALREAIRELAGYQDLGEGAFTARKRHVDALQRAAAHFSAGVAALENSKAGELLAEELRLAQRALSEITGSFTSDDLLGRIFSEFCIGK
ncbi:MAG: tRNA uridine-5-carboxymethylaminomethyl(34) synthesis GTPase MnmE [Gammaproteobacteria bacterium]|nr:tRNA uridine-5-carboxymethylaminomethyl(34) synthesis GTPase MnmE [Gammaproteobacteria bacterium]MDH4316588.1 tRNA uridine-5-carboxymethylaminomethyl(34) synthesis GTPase MnmE [Gammaproteobacteria bacterium]MDH5215966.1 tRNA uridine-5-carboxymethylaminomethyl(34) synthesis GTPase MnmE [Gammaproteobacteria bacterium]